MKVIIVIINHNINQNAIRLKQQFIQLAPTLLIDSGSRLGEEESFFFDRIMPNIFYSGLINEVCSMTSHEDDETVVYIICSDVEFKDPFHAYERLTKTFTDPKVGIYAPSANDSSHKHMVVGNGRGLREVTFVEGFCFAARLRLIRSLCPVDVNVNRIGWGLDVVLGYIALKAHLKSVVDYEVAVFHPMPSGYDSDQARIQRDSWLKILSKGAQRFQKLTSFPFCNTKLGMHIFKLIFR